MLDGYEAILWGKTTHESSYIENKKTFKDNFRKFSGSSFLIILYSLILLPLGSVNSENDILYIWNIYKLEWFFIYLVVGHCIVVLGQISFRLSYLFNVDG